jgi:probable rRNA maturation factor
VSTPLYLEFLNSQNSLNLDFKKIKKIATFIIQNELSLYLLKHKIDFFWKRVEFYIDWIDEKTMIALHRKTHNDSSPTDVISIDYWEEAFPTETFVLGEVFVNVDEAKKVWETQKTSINFELLLYLIHGILHVFHYDDRTKKDRLKMRKRESFYMNIFSKIPILKATKA